MVRTIPIAVLAAMISLLPAFAWGDSVPPVKDPPTLKECGGCHMAFQPAFLPARSWKRMMDELANHFGEDASLPPDKVQAIRAYLSANAGDNVTAKPARKYMRMVTPGGAPQRITENPEFARKHRFPERIWKDPKVVTKSNCPACHLGADQGLYDDD